MRTTRFGSSGPFCSTSFSRFDPVEKLHHVVERAALRDSEVVELDGVRRFQARRDLRLALEASKRHVVERSGTAVFVTADELHGGRSRKHLVPRAPHLAHAALRNAAFELVHPHATGVFDLSPEPFHAKGREVAEEARDESGSKQRGEPRDPFSTAPTFERAQDDAEREKHGRYERPGDRCRARRLGMPLPGRFFPELWLRNHLTEPPLSAEVPLSRTIRGASCHGCLRSTNRRSAKFHPDRRNALPG